MGPGPEDPLDWKNELERALAQEGTVVRVRLEKRRYGKPVTVLDGFDAALELGDVAKTLKRTLGTGGTVKQNAVELQGDHRRAVREWLETNGFQADVK